MMKNYYGIAALLIVCIVSLIYSGVKFEDNFDTKDNWANIVGQGNFTETVTNGKYTIKNTKNTDNFVIFKHSENFTDFTYAVMTNVSGTMNKGCAILFCLQSSIAGYQFGIMGNKQYYLGKWTTAGQSVTFSSIYANFNSFIYNSDNILKVSKKGSEISLFCNGILLTKITDSNYNSGAIGIAVGGNETVNFDYAVVLDTAQVGVEPTWFIDNFDDANTNGWRILQGAGSVESGSGVLKVAPTTALNLYVDGNYKVQPCTTIVTFTEGNKGVLYGQAYFESTVSTSGITIKSYYFLINANKSYALMSTTGQSTSGANSFIHGTTDTLIVDRDYGFTVNGHLLDDTTFSQGLNFNGVGLYVDAGIKVEFDKFSAGTNPGTPIIYNPYNGKVAKAKTSYLLGGAGIIYDIKGRNVATFQHGYKDKLRNLGAGRYFIVIPNNDKEYLIRQAIINAQN